MSEFASSVLDWKTECELNNPLPNQVLSVTTTSSDIQDFCSRFGLATIPELKPGLVGRIFGVDVYCDAEATA